MRRLGRLLVALCLPLHGGGANPPPLRPVVLGLAVNYGWEHVRVFVVSLRDVAGYAGDVTLFTSRGLDATTRAKLDRYRVGRVAVDVGRFPYFADAADADAYAGALADDARAPRVPHTSARHRLYYAFLRVNARGYTHALLSDVRDVVFQGDPFGWISAAEARRARVWFAQEDVTYSLGACPINSRYLEPYAERWPGGVPAGVLERNISCAGTVLGSVGVLVEYLGAMREHVRALAPHAGFQAVASYDQGVHNAVVYAHAWSCASCARALENNIGPVRTLAYELHLRYRTLCGTELRAGSVNCAAPLRELVRVDADGAALLNADGAAPPIVHQYDREPQLVALVERRVAAAERGASGGASAAATAPGGPAPWKLGRGVRLLDPEPPPPRADGGGLIYGLSPE